MAPRLAWLLVGPLRPCASGRWSKKPSPRGGPDPSDRDPAAFAARSPVPPRISAFERPVPWPREWNGPRGPGRRASAGTVKETGESRGTPDSKRENPGCCVQWRLEGRPVGTDAHHFFSADPGKCAIPTCLYLLMVL